MSHYRGVPEGSRVYTILEMKEYFGIAHSTGIDLYSSDRFERTIGYDKWVWSDHPHLYHQFHCRDDYHNIYSKVSATQPAQSDISAVIMFEHSERLYHKKLDYYALSEDLLYETFGPIQSQKVSNELYPHLHFVQRLYSEHTLHSSCKDYATSIICLKINNIRQQKLTNTTYLYSCDLNQQL
jgi:hypothetical protein